MQVPDSGDMLPKWRKTGAGLGNRNEPTRLLMPGCTDYSHPLLDNGMVHPDDSPITDHHVRPGRVADDDVLPPHLLQCIFHKEQQQ